ncbi:hypothetical protein KCP74_01055 [Salmonella enterica subsp. enterica]|nr:hypothetical protein KCP74_01055 [Salmonella enterica subsp. enterica]
MNFRLFAVQRRLHWRAATSAPVIDANQRVHQPPAFPEPLPLNRRAKPLPSPDPLAPAEFACWMDHPDHHIAGFPACSPASFNA